MLMVENQVQFLNNVMNNNLFWGHSGVQYTEH